MATNFPSSLDSLTNPTSSDSLASPSHSAQHANVNDAVEALQAKVGVDGSAVTSSLDYKVENLITGALGGKVLQVDSVTKTTVFSTTSTSPVEVTDMERSITPSSTSSKILVLLKVSFSQNSSGESAQLYLYRGTTQIQFLTQQEYYAAYTMNEVSCCFLDSPATTSSVQYRLRAATSAGGTTRINARATDGTNMGGSTMTVMEISA